MLRVAALDNRPMSLGKRKSSLSLSLPGSSISITEREGREGGREREGRRKGEREGKGREGGGREREG